MNPIDEDPQRSRATPPPATEPSGIQGVVLEEAASLAPHAGLTSGLRSGVRSGVRATTAEAAVLSGIELLSTVVVARLLSPTDFGLVAQVAVFHGFLSSLADAGIGNALIHYQDAEEGELSTLYWAQVALALVVGGILAAVAPMIGAFYDEPRLVPIGLLLSTSPLLAAAGAQHAVLLKRDLRFRPLAAVHIGSAAFGLVVTIIAALLGLAFYSLVAGTLARAAFTSAALTAVHWRTWHPRLHFRASGLRRYLRFGAFQVGERSINYWTGNLDYLLVGKFVGPEALGVYRLAYELAVKPVQAINPIVTKVMFPVFARLQTDDHTTSRWYAESLRMLAAANAPLLAAIGVAAPWLVPTVFGAQWQPAAPLLSVLVFMGGQPYRQPGGVGTPRPGQG